MESGRSKKTVGKYENIYENMMQKLAYVATKAHVCAFRDQCQPQKQLLTLDPC